MHRIVGYVDTTQILLHAIELSLSHGLRREHWGPVNNSNGITSSSSTKESKTAPQRPARPVLERLFHIESHQNEQDRATEPTEPLRTQYMQFYLGEKLMTNSFFGTLLPKLEKPRSKKNFLLTRTPQLHSQLSYRESRIIESQIILNRKETKKNNEHAWTQ